jgi:hypothetical protein
MSLKTSLDVGRAYVEQKDSYPIEKMNDTPGKAKVFVETGHAPSPASVSHFRLLLP